MTAWNGQLWSGGLAGSGAIVPSQARYSDLGVIAAGATVPAGSLLPAVAGRFIPQSGATTWIRISETAAKAGDTILVTWAGNRTTTPTNPATRRVVGSASGEPGTTVLPDGTIEFALSSTNPDATHATWVLIKNPN